MKNVVFEKGGIKMFEVMFALFVVLFPIFISIAFDAREE